MRAQRPSLFLASGNATFGLRLPYEAMSELVVQHRRENPKTSELEDKGKALVQEGFARASAVQFVRSVCGWGGYDGIAGRVLKRNSHANLADALRRAWEALRRDPSAPEVALTYMNGLRSLGTPSFASKHLRFLCPEYCPVFDSLLQQALPYSFDAQGYGDFARDCRRLAEELVSKGVPGPAYRPSMRWYAADVEAALYMHVKGRQLDSE